MNACLEAERTFLPSSVVAFVLPHQIASLIRGGANAGPWRNDELCPKGTPRRDDDALAPPKARTSSPLKKERKKKKSVFQESIGVILLILKMEQKFYTNYRLYEHDHKTTVHT